MTKQASPMFTETGHSPRGSTHGLTRSCVLYTVYRHYHLVSRHEQMGDWSQLTR